MPESRVKEAIALLVIGVAACSDAPVDSGTGSTESAGGSPSGPGITTSGSGGTSPVYSGSGGGAGGENSGMGGAVGRSGGAGMGGVANHGGSAGGAGALVGADGGGSIAMPDAQGCATGAPGVWENVTPPSMSMDPNTGGTDQNYGANGLVVDPTHTNVLYTSVCWQGVWKSMDCGKTWKKVSTGTNASHLDRGKPWALAIAPDSSYLLTTSGNNDQLGIYKSTDEGVNWTFYAVPYPGSDVYTIAISPYDKNHVVTTSHTFAAGEIYESVDAGQTWKNNGPMGTSGDAGYLDFLFDDGTLLLTNDGDNGNYSGTWRGVRSGSTWPWTWSWTHVNKQQHFHGSHQAFVDAVNHVVVNPGAFGIFRSTDAGLTWDSVSSNMSNTMIGTAAKLYATASYASGAYAPRLQQAARVPGTSWMSGDTPNAMTNGAARFATTFDGTHHIVVSANWRAGMWRYVEP
jgi:hypothetical protein